MNNTVFGENTNVDSGLLQMTADVVAAYVNANPVQATDLPTLITQVHGTLQNLDKGQAEPEPVQQEPAVNPKRSVKPDRIICLECGESFKSLKRHLKAAHDLTPDQYRAKWGLQDDYPMTAPNYSKRRSELAQEIGLGRTAG